MNNGDVTACARGYPFLDDQFLLEIDTHEDATGASVESMLMPDAKTEAVEPRHVAGAVGG